MSTEHGFTTFFSNKENKSIILANSTRFKRKENKILCKIIYKEVVQGKLKEWVNKTLVVNLDREYN